MYTPLGNEFGFLDSLIAAVVSILIVFLVLVLIIAIASLFSKVIMIVDNKTNIKPRKENKLLEDDEDAVVATIVASMDFYRETNKHARLVKITREEE